MSSLILSKTYERDLIRVSLKVDEERVSRSGFSCVALSRRRSPLRTMNVQSLAEDKRRKYDQLGPSRIIQRSTAMAVIHPMVLIHDSPKTFSIALFVFTIHLTSSEQFMSHFGMDDDFGE